MPLSASETVRIRQLVSESTDDVFSDSDIQTVSDAMAKVIDASGYAPSHASYTDTYDIYLLASELWRIKAGNFADEFDFAAEGGKFNRSQKYRMALDQAKRYSDMSRQRSSSTSSA